MEQVVLVDDQNNVLGFADKATVHTQNTPLHRGFSVFIFNNKKQLLLTQRAKNKKTFPGVWTNTVCGHPGPNETDVAAAKRRLKDEMGLVVDNVTVVSPYRYRFADANGVVENEICPILIGFGDVDPQPNPQEMAAWKWIGWSEFLQAIKLHPEVYSPWCIEEAKIINHLHVITQSK